jgi:hypothetical protein
VNSIKSIKEKIGDAPEVNQWKLEKKETLDWVTLACYKDSLKISDHGFIRYFKISIDDFLKGFSTDTITNEGEDQAIREVWMCNKCLRENQIEDKTCIKCNNAMERNLSRDSERSERRKKSRSKGRSNGELSLGNNLGGSQKL